MTEDAASWPSPRDRVEPFCIHAGRCGGCPLQHAAAAAQLRRKESVLLRSLEDAAGAVPGDFVLLPPVAARSVRYRRKARLSVRHVEKKGGTLVGFRERNGRLVTDMRECPVLVEAASALIDPLRRLLSGLACARAIPQIEVAAGESAGAGRSDHVALTVRHIRPLPREDARALSDFAAERGVDLYLQPGGPGTVRKVFPEEGAERLRYSLPAWDIELGFHPADFIQVNAEVNRMLVDRVVAALDPGPQDRVLDLFCGIGNITLPLARRCGHATGVEGSAEMTERARENARRNGVENAVFHTADLAAPLDAQGWARRSFAGVVLDPPRSGAIELMGAVAAAGARTVVYVSCSVATLARDAALLIEVGYRLKSAGVMDMFPHTAHVESMAVFERAAGRLPGTDR